MSGKLGVLILLGAVPWAPLGCGSRPRPATRWSDKIERSCYATVQGQPVNSTLISVSEQGAERLLGVTELGTGERLIEEAIIDTSGRLVEAEATLTLAAGQGGPGPQGATRVWFRPEEHAVELTGPALHLEWRVPDDLPWVWVSLLTTALAPGQGRGPIATPLGARVALRAAEGGHAVRLLDLGALQQHTLAADQLVVEEGDGAGATVVLGDDAIDVEEGVPRRLHLAALDTSLELLDARAPSSALVAALRCTALSGSFTP